jgi:hypothetical protein
VQLKAAIGTFFVEFSKFETQFVGMALRSLSKDSMFVEHAETLLDLEARLKLLERLAFARDIPPALIGELEVLLLRARKLHELRQGVARNLVTVEADVKPALGVPPSKINRLKPRKADYAQLAQVATLVPTIPEVQTHTAEAIELQHSLHAMSDKLDRHLSAVAACA